MAESTVTVSAVRFSMPFNMNKFTRNMIICAVALVVVSVSALLIFKSIGGGDIKAVTKDANNFSANVETSTIAAGDRAWGEDGNAQTTNSGNSATEPTSDASNGAGSATAPAQQNDGTTQSGGSTQPGGSSQQSTRPTASNPAAKVTTTAAAKPNSSAELKQKYEEEMSGNSKNDGDDSSVDEMLGYMENGGVFSYMYNDTGEFFYTENDPWQRMFGFNTLYDWAAPLTVMWYDTVRLKFNYDNTDWMVQLWKGQYGYVFVGSEIGVYTRNPLSDVDHYECADDNHLIPMQMSLYQDGKKLFTRKYAPQWWCTGFTYGHLTDYKFNDRSCLTMEAMMTFYSEEMAQLFAQQLAAAGFTNVSTLNVSRGETFAVDGKNVHFIWKNLDQKLG